MKQTVQKEVVICDSCGTQESYCSRCRNCGKDHCYNCQKTSGVSYSHGVHFSGSGDGYYCLQCDRSLRATGDNSLHSAYLAIQALRAEERRWAEDFRVRQVAVEEEVKRLAT